MYVAEVQGTKREGGDGGGGIPREGTAIGHAQLADGFSVRFVGTSGEHPRLLLVVGLLLAFWAFDKCVVWQTKGSQ